MTGTMPGSSACPLCGVAASVRWVSEDAVWDVDCHTCRRYTIDDYLIGVVRQARVSDTRGVMDLLPGLAKRSARTWGDGGRLNLTGDNFASIAHNASREEPVRHGDR